VGTPTSHHYGVSITNRNRSGPARHIQNGEGGLLGPYDYHGYRLIALGGPGAAGSRLLGWPWGRGRPFPPSGWSDSFPGGGDCPTGGPPIRSTDGSCAGGDTLRRPVRPQSAAINPNCQNVRNPSHIRRMLLAANDAVREVSLCWVPAHVGIPPNELADDLANIARAGGRMVTCPLPLSTWNQAITDSVMATWKVMWSTDPLGRHLQPPPAPTHLAPLVPPRRRCSSGHHNYLAPTPGPHTRP